MEENKFWVTSSRPSNFGDPIDTKTKVDNWFDQNRYESFFNRDGIYLLLIDCGMKKTGIMKSRELRFICSKGLLLAAIFLE